MTDFTDSQNRALEFATTVLDSSDTEKALEAYNRLDHQFAKVDSPRVDRLMASLDRLMS